MTDSAGNPVDGALVRILGQSYYNPDNYSTCITGVTDINGVLVLELGDNRNFKGEVYSPAGDAPVTTIVENTEAGGNYEYNVELPGLVDLPQVTDMGTPPGDTPIWRLSATVDVPMAIQYGLLKPPTGGDLIRTSQTEITPGTADIFLVDAIQKTAWENSEPFHAYHVMREASTYQQTMTLNENGWTFVISNRHHYGHRETVDLELALEQYDGETWTEVDTISRQISLEPGDVYTASFGEGIFSLDFEIPANEFREGDTFFLNLNAGNSSETAVETDLYVLLDVYGEFFAYPTWLNIGEGLPKTELSLSPVSLETMNIMPSFTMPAVPDSGPYYFYCAAFEPGTLAGDTIMGNVDIAEFYLAE